MSLEDRLFLAFAVAAVFLAILIVLGQVAVALWRRLRDAEERIERLELCTIIDDAVQRLLRPGANTGDDAEDDRADAASPPMPRVIFSQPAFEQQARNFRQEHNRRPGIETGFALVGRIEGSGSDRRLVVNGLIDAGDDDRSVGHVRFNRDYQQRQLERLQLVDARASHIGDAHTHPGAMDHCSEGDYHTDAANVRASNSQEMIFVIATEAAAHHYRSSPMSIYSEGFKFDFFYLGHASEYRYKPVHVEVSPAEPILQFPDQLAALARHDPSRFRFDWACLRNLPGWAVSVGEIELEDDKRPCIELVSGEGRGTILLVLPDDPVQAPRVYVQRDGEFAAFVPDFLANGWSGHIWLTEVALSAARELQRRRAPEAGESAQFSSRLVVPV